MRLPVCLLIALGSLLPTLARSQSSEETVTSSSDFPPKKFKAGRYDAIWQKNPFVSEGVAEIRPDEAVHEWAKGFVLRAVTRIQGKYVVHLENTRPPKVAVASKTTNRYFRLVEDADSPSGLSITRVKAHRDPSQVEVMVAFKNGETQSEAVIKYDPRALRARPAVQQNRVTPSQGMPPTPAQDQIPSVPATSARSSESRENAERRPTDARKEVQDAGGGRAEQRGRTQGGRDRGRRGGRGRVRASDRDNPNQSQPPQRRVVLPSNKR